MPSSEHDDNQEMYPDLYPDECCVYDAQKFYLAAENSHLTFSITLPVSPPTIDSSQLDRPFHMDLNTKVLDIAQKTGLLFPSPFAVSSVLRTDSEPGSPQWHAIQFMQLCWGLVHIGNKPRHGQAERGRILSFWDLPYHGFTVTNFKKISGLLDPISTGSYYLIGEFRLVLLDSGVDLIFYLSTEVRPT
jgi:hypothetical protein